MVGTHFADAEMPAKRAGRRHLSPALEETRPIEDVSKLNAFLIINIECFIIYPKRSAAYQAGETPRAAFIVGRCVLRRLLGRNSVVPRIGRPARYGYTTRVLTICPCAGGCVRDTPAQELFAFHSQAEYENPIPSSDR